MSITLTPAQVRWLEAEVAAGRFASVDAAAQAIIAERMAGELEAGELEAGELDLDDLDWVKPYLDEARAEVARGEVVPWDEVKRELAELKSKLR